MVKQNEIIVGSRYLNGQMMYPGVWIQTWFLMFNSVWVLVEFKPKE